MKRPYTAHSVRFTDSQRRNHLARMLAGGNFDKFIRVASMPLFEVALKGAEALQAWRKQQ